MLTIISSSLNATSNSRVLAGQALEAARVQAIEARVVDLRDFPLAVCDGDESYGQPHVEQLAAMLRDSSAVIFASPIYNYDVSAALKNLIEHVGGELTDKVVGFMCAAGGQRSYMAPLQFLNSLMLDFRSLIVPRFVYASRDAFEEGKIVEQGLHERIGELVAHTYKLACALGR